MNLQRDNQIKMTFLHGQILLFKSQKITAQTSHDNKTGVIFHLLFFICYLSFVIFHMNRFHMNRFDLNRFDLALHIIGLLTIWIYVHLKHMVRFQITSLNTITFYSTFKIIISH